MGRFNFARAAIICLVLVLAIGAAGMSYAKTQGGIRDPGAVTTATSCCADPFTWVVSNDDGSEDSVSPYGLIDPGDDGGGTNYDKWGSLSSDDPSEPQTMGVVCARYDKDVARTTASISEDHAEITVLVENAYPCYYPTVFFALACPESAMGTITDIVITNDHPDELTVTTTGIYVGQPIPQSGEVTGAVHVHLEQPAAQGTCYTFSISITSECICEEPTCGTAYGYIPGYATCFLSLGFDKWGWTNGPLGPGTYEFQLWGGAAGCDLSKGTLVGWLTVSYDGSAAVVTYHMYDDNYMTATHLYVGSERMPRDKKGNETTSPGQYPYVHGSLSNASTDTYTVTGLSGSIYVVAHALTCWYE